MAVEKANREICYLSDIFADLSKDKKRDILKTAKSLLKVQREDAVVLADAPSSVEAEERLA